MNRQISIVLCETSHPGNIGASARAIKNMGLNDLVLVNPQQFPHPEATHRASGADDVLANARIVTSLEEALHDKTWIFGTSSRAREIPWPQLSAEALGNFVHQRPETESMAILFGNERAGLSNEQLQLCTHHVYIPANPLYASLNLSQAVQILTYELYKHAHAMPAVVAFDEMATQAQIEGLIDHIQQVATQTGFYNPNNPKRLFQRLRRLISKAQLESEEVNILRGFLKHIPVPETNLD